MTTILDTKTIRDQVYVEWLKEHAKPSCKHCYGRGYLGILTEAGGKLLECKCVRR